MCRTHILSNEEYIVALEAKLNEEVAEYQADKNLEEMADVLEVLHAICVARGYSLAELEAMRANKAEKRGGFKEKILTSGFTIPVDKWDIFAKCLGANLQKGERKEIVVWVGQLKCSASYTNVNLTGENAGRTVFQVRYSGDLVSELRKIFSPNSDNYDAVGGKLEVYSGKVGELTFKCLPAVTVNTINEDSAVSTTPGVMNLNTVVTKILNDYVPSKKETFAGHQMGSFFRSDIPLAIYETGIVESAPYLITGSVGQGNWAMIPWVCIFDRKITTTATKGIYIVYLLSKDGNSLYLSFNQGCTDIRKNNSKKDTIRIMREKAEDIRKRIDSRGFNADNNAKLGDGLTELGELYQEGMIFYKEYKKGNVPGESELQNDLRLMMDIYKEYVNGKAENTEIIDVEVGEEQLSTKDTLDQIKKYIAAKGFTFNEGLVENYYLSLKSKPFVILAGTSGTGKTRLVRLFAEAIGATSQNGRYKLVSVRPDWSDSSDLFGHVNLNDKFIPGAIIDFVKQAELDSRNPYFLCLDEMNLARVEYYLSDILSIIETREYVDGKVTTDPLITENYYGADITAKGKYGVVRIPENLYIIGTVNMDETTFPFSRKVLDRANTIEFSTVELLANFDSTQGEVKAIFADNTFMKADYVFFNQCASDKDFVEDVCIELQDINMILEKANAHVGYRVRDEIVFYMLNNKNAGNLLTRNQAFDHEIMQKILPRIQGSSASVKIMLCELFKYCAGDYESYQTESDDVSAKMMAAANKETCKYKESAKKIAFMVRRFEEDGFTAYWL